MSMHGHCNRCITALERNEMREKKEKHWADEQSGWTIETPAEAFELKCKRQALSGVPVKLHGVFNGHNTMLALHDTLCNRTLMLIIQQEKNVVFRMSWIVRFCT